MYAPRIKSADTLAEYEIGDCRALLLGNIESAGSVGYLYILVVYRQTEEEPCLFVASETHATARFFGGGSHFLGVFTTNGHANMGASDDWSDAAKFVDAALDLAREHLGVQ